LGTDVNFTLIQNQVKCSTNRQLYAHTYHWNSIASRCIALHTPETSWTESKEICKDLQKHHPPNSPRF